MLNRNSIVMQSKEINSTDLDDEKVMMNIQKGKYYALNSVASSIWERINEKICVKDLIDIIIKEYDVEYNVCEESVMRLLKELAENNLIEILG